MTEEELKEEAPRVKGGYELLVAMDKYALEHEGYLPKNISDDFWEIKNWLHNQLNEFEAAYRRFPIGTDPGGIGGDFVDGPFRSDPAPH